jgi:hypothetical protein
VRFLLDANKPRSALEALRAYGHEAVHVRDIGLGDASDALIAERARADDLARSGFRGCSALSAESCNGDHRAGGLAIDGWFADARQTARPTACRCCSSPAQPATLVEASNAPVSLTSGVAMSPCAGVPHDAMRKARGRVALRPASSPPGALARGIGLETAHVYIAGLYRSAWRFRCITPPSFS